MLCRLSFIFCMRSSSFIPSLLIRSLSCYVLLYLKLHFGRFYFLSILLALCSCLTLICLIRCYHQFVELNFCFCSCFCLLKIYVLSRSSFDIYEVCVDFVSIFATDSTFEEVKVRDLFCWLLINNYFRTHRKISLESHNRCLFSDILKLQFLHV